MNYELRCESYCSIKKCRLCHVYCEYTNNIINIGRNQYHRTCLDRFWFEIPKRDKYKMIDLFLNQNSKITF